MAIPTVEVQRLTIRQLRADNKRLSVALATLLQACDWRHESGDMEPYFQAHHDAVMLLDKLGGDGEHGN